MKVNRTTIARALGATLLGTALVAGSAFAQPYGEHRHRGGQPMAQMSEAERAQMRERMQARMSQRLDRLAARLEIKASQQEAWSAYRKVRETAFQNRPQWPGRDADAATLTRFRAEMAQQRAQRMAAMADATAKLQAALEPDQRKVLDEITRSPGPRGQHRGGRGGGHGGHGGHHGGYGRG